jgi:hypothetical protein
VWVSFLNCSCNPKLFILFGRICILILQGTFFLYHLPSFYKKTKEVCLTLKSILRQKKNFGNPLKETNLILQDDHNTL